MFRIPVCAAPCSRSSFPNGGTRDAAHIWLSSSGTVQPTWSPVDLIAPERWTASVAQRRAVAHELLTTPNRLPSPTFCFSIINPDPRWPDYPSAGWLDGIEIDSSLRNRRNVAGLEKFVRCHSEFIAGREISFHFAGIKALAAPRPLSAVGFYFAFGTRRRNIRRQGFAVVFRGMRYNYGICCCSSCSWFSSVWMAYWIGGQSLRGSVFILTSRVFEDYYYYCTPSLNSCNDMHHGKEINFQALLACVLMAMIQRNIVGAIIKSDLKTL